MERDVECNGDSRELPAPHDTRLTAFFAFRTHWRLQGSNIAPIDTHLMAVLALQSPVSRGP